MRGVRFNNGSFLFSDVSRTSQHAVRFKKQTKHKLRGFDDRKFLR